MAVYTDITRDELERMLGIYEGLGALKSFEGIAAGSINTTFRVELDDGVYYLRINEGKAFADLVHEKDLLEHLAQKTTTLHDVVTPRIVKNCIGGYFFPVVPGKYAALFPEISGRELGVFELNAHHLHQVGAALARCHLAMQSFESDRVNPFGVPTVSTWVREFLDAGVLPDVSTRLRAVLDDCKALADDALPRGVIHGDLFINNTKWRRGELHAIFDWEMAGLDAFVVDIAITTLAWCWRRESGELPAAFLDNLARALIEGYSVVRPLEEPERAAFFSALRFAAVRFATTRIRDFVVGKERAGDTSRAFLDYREYIDRLDALELMGPARVRAIATDLRGTSAS